MPQKIDCKICNIIEKAGFESRLGVFLIDYFCNTAFLDKADKVVYVGKFC